MFNKELLEMTYLFEELLLDLVEGPGFGQIIKDDDKIYDYVFDFWKISEEEFRSKYFYTLNCIKVVDSKDLFKAQRLLIRANNMMKSDLKKAMNLVSTVSIRISFKLKFLLTLQFLGYFVCSRIKYSFGKCL